MVIDLLVWLCTTPRVGQNAVLGSLRHAVPGAGEYGEAHPSDGVLILSASFPVSIEKARRHQFVRIRRQDRIAQAVSWAHAAATGRFHSWQAGRPGNFDASCVDAALETIEQRERVWDDYLSGHDVLELVYETDISPDPTAAARRILDWCDIDGEPGPTDVEPFSMAQKREWRSRWESA